MSKAGEQPGKGRYTCVTCGHVVFLKKDSDALGVCPHCDSKRYAP